MNQEQNPFDEFISSLLEEIMGKPAFQEMSEDEKERVRNKIQEHLQKKILDTLMQRLEEGQKQELSEALEQGSEVAEAKITQLSASLPGLMDDIEENLREEAELFKAIKGS